MEQSFPEISGVSDSSETSISGEEKTLDVPMRVEEMDDVSTEEDISNPTTNEVDSLWIPQNTLKAMNNIMVTWTGDDLLELLNRIKAAVPENDYMKYSKRAKKIAWDEIAFNGHSSKDCSFVWFYIQKNIRNHRTLEEILCDAEQLIDTKLKSLNKKRKHRHPEQPKKPLSAYMIFSSEKVEEVYQENPDIKNTDVFKVIATMYHKLSEDDRKIYAKRADELKIIYEEQMKKFYIKYPHLQRKMPSPDDKPQTPFQIYYERQITAAPSSSQSTAVSKKEFKEKWKNMDKEDKIVYINLAVENERKFYGEKKRKYKSILKKEERVLIEKQAGKPEKPPRSAYVLFTQAELKKDEIQNLNINKRMKVVSMRWNKCSEEIKAKYKSETTELKAKYKSEYDDYLKSLPDEHRGEELKQKRKKHKISSKNSQIHKKSKIESSGRNNLVIPQPPLPAPDLFAESLKDKNINADLAWIRLSRKEQNIYKKKWKELHTKYLDDIELHARTTMRNQTGNTEPTSEEDTVSSTSSSPSKENENEDSGTEDSSSDSSNSEESGSDDESSSDDSN